MKSNLKDNIWIEGFSNDELASYTKESWRDHICDKDILYSGITLDIPEELAKECVKYKYHKSKSNLVVPQELYWFYSYKYSKATQYKFETAK